MRRRDFIRTAAAGLAGSVLLTGRAAASSEHIHGIFRFVDPPSSAKLQECLNVLAACDYPWERCVPELEKESDGLVTVVWEDTGQGNSGMYFSGLRNGVRNVIVLNSRYTSTDHTFTFAHEAGHMVDDTALRDDQRAALLEKWHADDDGRYTGDPNAGSEWGHEAEHAETWRNNAGYFQRPNEAFADAFVICFAPSIFPYKRFAHWSDDTAGVREIILSELPPPPPPKTWAFPNDAIYRLYRATFLREPDRGGYDHWWKHHRGGASLVTIGELFTRSAEFGQRYGAQTDREFVTMLYRNVMDRSPDAGGLEHWVRHLQAGYSRGFVLVGFSESQEFYRKINNERK